MGGKGISGDSGVRCQPQSKPIKVNLQQLASKLLPSWLYKMYLKCKIVKNLLSKFQMGVSSHKLGMAWYLYSISMTLIVMVHYPLIFYIKGDMAQYYWIW